MEFIIVEIILVSFAINLWAINPDFIITKLRCVDRDEDMCINLNCNLKRKTSNISEIEINFMLGYPMHEIYVTVDLSYKYGDQQYSLLRFNDLDFCDTMKTNWTSKIIVKILDEHFDIHNCPYIGRIRLENYNVLSKFASDRWKTGEFQLYIRAFDDRNRTIISPVLYGRLSVPRAMQMLTKIFD